MEGPMTMPAPLTEVQRDNLNIERGSIDKLKKYKRVCLVQLLYWISTAFPPLITGSNPVAATFFNSALSRLPIWCHTKVFPQLDICASVWRSNEKLEKRVLPKWRRKHCQDQGRYLFAGRKLGFAGMFLIWKNRKSWLVGYTPKLSR